MNTEVLRTDWVGIVVDRRFPLVQLLGSSGQSSVYLTELDGNPEQKAVIKLIPTHAEGAHSRAINWAAAATLSHPHLIRVFHTGNCCLEETEYLYSVTEYAPEVLSEILPERHLTGSEAKEMLGSILDALTYLRDHGFIHSRLKPSNILAVDDSLKLSADAVHMPASPARQGATLQVYDAPEWGQGPIGPAADVWSLGVTLVEALTQIPPVWNRSSQSDPIVPPSLPESFPQIVRECLRRDAALRCSIDELRASVESGSSLSRRARTAATEAKPPRAGNRRVAILSACAAVLLAGFAVVMLRSNGSAAARTTSATVAMPVASKPVTTKHAATSRQPAAVQPVPVAAPAAAPVAAAPAPVPVQVASATPIPAARADSPAPVPAPTVRVPNGPATKGTVAQQVLPDVPARAIHTIQGTVRIAIRANVDAKGAVSDASIDSQGPSQYFANLALKAARSWKFAPPEVNGQGVPSVWLLHFEFRQSGVDVAPAEQTP